MFKESLMCTRFATSAESLPFEVYTFFDYRVNCLLKILWVKLLSLEIRPVDIKSIFHSKCYYRSIDAHQNHRVENIQRERPHVPTFVPTLIPAAFVPLHFRHKVDTRLPNWLGGCDQANTPTKRTERASSPRGNRTANEKWERCIQKWNSLLAEHIIINEPERAEGSEEAKGARQVAQSHGPAHLRTKIHLTYSSFTGHNSLLMAARSTDLREYFRVHRHKYEKYPGFFSPSARRGPLGARTNISYNRCPTMSTWQRVSHTFMFCLYFCYESVCHM